MKQQTHTGNKPNTSTIYQVKGELIITRADGTVIREAEALEWIASRIEAGMYVRNALSKHVINN